MKYVNIRKHLPLLLALVGYTGLMGNLWFARNISLGIAAMLLYLASLSWLIGKKFFPSEDSSLQTLVGFLIFTAGFAFAGTVVYYPFGFNHLTATGLFALPFLTLLFKRDASIKNEPEPVNKGDIKNGIFFFAAILLVEGSLILILLRASTTGILISPWQQLNVFFFLLYALATGLLLATANRIHSLALRLLVISLHLFVTWNVATLIYTLGFGFDGFIHRAAETWIREHGVIYPKTPFYIGQYALVVLTSLVTGVSIFTLDVFLVPFLSALLFPPLILLAANKIWRKDKKITLHFVWIIPLLYFLNFNLTTPHNLVLFFSVLIIFTALAYSRGKISFFIPAILTLASLATHPLLGAPLFVFLLSVFLLRHSQKARTRKFILMLTGITIIVLPSLMFGVNNYRLGFGLPTLTNPITQIGNFLELFARPFWYVQKAPLFFELLYSWQRFLPLVLVVVGLYGWIKEKSKEWVTLLFPLTGIFFFLSAWLLRSSIVFPGVAGSEQGNYPTRLIYSSILFLLPWIMYGSSEIYEKLKLQIEKWQPKFRSLALTFLVVASSGILTLSLYFSYPAMNPKVHFPGYNVTASDFEAVTWIHDNAGENSIVLANILVGAAALTEYSFAKDYATELGPVFYYSLPSGGPLYGYFTKMVYEGQKREYMDEAMNLTGADEAYFVMNSYWARFDAIVTETKKTADSWAVLGDGDIYIFRFNRHK